MSYSEAIEALLREQRKWAEGRGEQGFKPSSALATHFPRGQGAAFMADHLRYADPYYVAPDIGSALASAGASLPDARLDAEAAPSRVGWLWFARPLTVPGLRIHREQTCMTSAIRAISWSLTVREPNGRVYAVIDGAPETGSVAHGANILTYFMCDQGDGWHFAAIDAWPHAERLSETGPADEHGTESLALDGAERIAPFVRRLFFSFCAFVQQRIFTALPQRAERHARKRLERVGFPQEPLIRVVQLRRAHTRSEHHGDSEPVEWSHQWIVSGHWRQQWYPSLNANQPIWVMPYVKGPEDKPLKPPRAKVFAVIR